MTLSLRRQLYKHWMLSANYMWSHSIHDDGIGGGESDTPQTRHAGRVRRGIATTMRGMCSMRVPFTNCRWASSSTSKTFKIRERFGAQLRVECYNLANRAQLGQPLADISNPLNFGTITTLINTGATGGGTPRQFQFGLKFTF